MRVRKKSTLALLLIIVCIASSDVEEHSNPETTELTQDRCHASNGTFSIMCDKENDDTETTPSLIFDPNNIPDISDEERTAFFDCDEYRNAGWRCDTISRFGKRDNQSNFCDWDIIDLKDLTAELFAKKYFLHKPLLIRTTADTWSRDPKQFTRPAMAERWGDYEFEAGKSLDTVMNSGIGPRQAILKDYLTKFMPSDEIQPNPKDGSEEGEYIFDRTIWNEVEQFQEDYFASPSFFNKTNGDDGDYGIFFMGPTGSGVSFHVHAEVWTGIFYGTKRWFLYPPHFGPIGGFHPGYGVIDWINSIYPRVKGTADAPLECIQRTGDIMYVPDFWFHSVVNIGDTVAGTIQSKRGRTKWTKLFGVLGEAEEEIEEAHTEFEKEVARWKELRAHMEMSKMAPFNSAYFYQTGKQFFGLGKREEALEYLMKAVEIDPTFILARLDIAEILMVRSESYEEWVKGRDYLVETYNLNVHNDESADYLYDVCNDNDMTEVREIVDKRQVVQMPLEKFYRIERKENPSNGQRRIREADEDDDEVRMKQRIERLENDNARMRDQLRYLLEKVREIENRPCACKEDDRKE